MPEAFIEPWQPFEDEFGVIRNKILLAAAGELEINAVTSQPLLQGKLQNLPLNTKHVNCYNICARHLQLMRSIPAKAMLSTLVGMKENENVRSNLEVVRKPLLSRDDFFEILRPQKRVEFIDEEVNMS